MKILIILFTIIVTSYAGIKNTIFPDDSLKWECKGKRYEEVSLTGYYPEFSSSEGRRGFLDSRAKKLRTLQDFLDDRVPYVTIAMDEKLKIPYGTSVCIPELNRHYRRRIRFQVRDDGYELLGTGFSRADICVRSEVDSYDKAVNEKVTLVF
ncbi:uncharacterized protein LOC123296464 [Chrysoperla carnea]|uniref:uncharacterized protein LOC123296464 n=1 Tax=Chrysoperla carnea TaxID=189513 RepID=UPI001D09401C|nr:uncharacterized protein LOC123296464 [Chrysoperla carnea]